MAAGPGGGAAPDPGRDPGRRRCDRGRPGRHQRGRRPRGRFGSQAELLHRLDRHGDGPVYRVDFHHAGADPREALRRAEDLPEAELAGLLARLGRLDRAGRDGPWTAATLRLIGDRPGVRAADLAAAVGRERHPFKTDVRKRRKELGLTESLEVGYRLSPRGRALLARLGPSAPARAAVVVFQDPDRAGLWCMPAFGKGFVKWGRRW